MKRAVLLILDGWGLGEIPAVDAIKQANTPIIDDLMTNCANATLTTFGEDVGLPGGQMGNSEVGHMNIGAGRIVYQDLLKINKDIASGDFQRLDPIQDMLHQAKFGGRSVHFIGLLSDGGVHSHIDHLLALVDSADEVGVQDVYIHAFLDGRDTDPNHGQQYISRLLQYTEHKSANLATVIGRYYAMDRDRRWERTAQAYNLLVDGIGAETSDILNTLKQRYEAGETDEFIKPIIVNGGGQIKSGDTVMFFNFRSDRPRQLTTMLSRADFTAYGTKSLDLNFYSMTSYDETFDNVTALYDKRPLMNTFGELVAQYGGTQLRMAETEKYPHVTYFFSGGREEPFENEKRIMANSPKVATYDLQPEMSADELTQLLLNKLHSERPDFICLNFANTDMVGHTGVFEAAKIAAETVDACVGRILKRVKELHYDTIIIADHGNSDFMINEDGSPHTAHTINPVPIIYVPFEKNTRSLSSGVLADVAPTLADIMGLETFDEMTGKSLLSE